MKLLEEKVMCLDGIGKVVDRATEGHSIWVYEADFAVGSLTRLGA